jgi:hypothetical protein
MTDMWSSLIFGLVPGGYVRNSQHPSWQVAQQPADVFTEGETFVNAVLRHLAHSRSRGNVID